MTEPRVCRRCNLKKDANGFYFVSKKLGTLRGQCKDCMAEIKKLQQDPLWKPQCSRCHSPLMERMGPGRRLCRSCFVETYVVDDRRPNGAHRLRMKPCSLCGGEKIRFERGKLCLYCRPWRAAASAFRRYGLVPKDYEAILEAQKGVCAICKRPPGKQRLAIDHLHSKAAPLLRGLLCGFCNFQLLGIFKERKDWFAQAINYLEHPPAQILFPGRVIHS